VAAVSMLDDATLTGLRAEAQAAASPFIDPALFRAAEAMLPRVPADWLDRVIGRAGVSWRHLSNAELALAVSAYRADIDYLAALTTERHRQREAAQRAADAEARAQARAERAEWAALAARLPVPVEVWHNWTARHLDGYEQGAGHIVVLEDLTVGRFHRPARHPLCWTPSRTHPLRHVTPNVGDERRLPDCKACIRHAERIAQAKED
jgi:hypothetical protein